MIWAGSGAPWRGTVVEKVNRGNREEQRQRGEGEGAASSSQREHGCTSSQQRLQLRDVAPCADGLAWGYNQEAIDYGDASKHNNHTPSIQEAGSPPVDVLREDRDTGRVVSTPAPSAGSVRSPNSSLTSLAPSLALLTHSSGLSEEEDDDVQQAPRTFSSIDERIEKEGAMPPVPFAEDNNEVGGLQGLSPRSGQGTYAAQFLSPCGHSHQYTARIECSTGSILDPTSPRSDEMGMERSILSSGVDSVDTVSSLWTRDKGETSGAWKDDERNRGKNASWEVGAGEGMEGEGDSFAKEWEEGEDELSDHGRRQLGLLGEEGGGVACASPEDARSSSRQERGHATSAVLGLKTTSKGGLPPKKATDDSWDAEDTPRLDDYFRGKATVPPSEEHLLPPPFGGGGDGSLLFPSPPLEGKALYGVSTWSFESDSSGGGDGGGGGQHTAWKPSARSPSPKKKQNNEDSKHSPAEIFAFHAGRTKQTEAKFDRRGEQQPPRQQQQQQQQRWRRRRQRRREEKTSFGLGRCSANNGNTIAGGAPRRGRFYVQTVQQQNQHQSRPQQPTHTNEEDERGNRGGANSSSNNHNNSGSSGGGVGLSVSVSGGIRRRNGCVGGGNAGGHQKRHQEFLVKFGEEKRMERQEEEVKAQRREAARRRTRDILLERAKQRLLTVAVAAATSTAASSFCSNSISSSNAAESSGKRQASRAEGGSGGRCSSRDRGGQQDAATVASKVATVSASCEAGVGAAPTIALTALSAGTPLYAQDTWAARHSKVERKGNKEDITPEQKEKVEKEKFERIAATRRRQKEHHKRFLAGLKAKRVQEEANRLLQERKEAEKRCNVKMWAERRLQKIQKTCGAGGSEHIDLGGGGEGDGKGTAVGGVAGSGLNAIRKAHTRTEDAGGGLEEISAENTCLLSSSTTTAEPLEKTAQLAQVLDKEQRRRRFLELKLAREKAQQHLESLAKKKKEREDEEENAKRRKARRTKLLRDKVLCMAKELRQGGKATEGGQCPGMGDERSEEEKNGTVNTARVPRLTDEELQASVKRLTQQRKGGELITSSARDFNDWKRKHKVSSDTKVFVMTGWYPCVKKALIQRGWTQNPDRDSPFFDLKWTLHSQDIRTTDIEPWQLCNHFFKNVAITTKAGLLANLRNLKWFADCDCGEILPRGYDLSVETDVLAFLDDYCATAAESLLKHVLLRAKGRVAVRRLGSSTASSHNKQDHHDHLGGEASSMSSPTAGKNRGGEEEYEGKEIIGPKFRASSPLGNNDTRSNNSYDDEDDAFDDSDIDDDDTDKASYTDATIPVTAPTTSPSVDCLSAPAVPPINSAYIMARNADDATASTSTPSGSSLTGDVPNAGPRQQQRQQQHQQLQQQASEVPITPSPAHTGTEVTPRTSPLRSVAMKSEKGGGTKDGDVLTAEQDRVAYPKGGSGKRGGGDEGRKLRKQAVPVSARRRQWEPEGAGIQVNAEILKAALAVCRRRHASIGEGEGEGGLDSGGSIEAVCSDLEWELIGLGTGGGAPHPDMPGLYRPHPLPSRPATPLEAFIQTQAETEASAGSGGRGQRRRQKQQDELRAACAERLKTVVPLGEAMLDDIQAVLERAAEASRSQFDLNGDFCQNMWIVKPAAKSRGRGIECFTELDKLLSYTESKQSQAVSQWVVHKYIENPLIIASRKFDMRQWVLVTDWNPLTVWFYDRCYVRFGVEEYTTSGSNIGNSFVHLVNNSICKKSDNFGQVSTTDNGVEVHEHMWSNEVFTAYVDEVAGEGCWRKKMQPRMEQIVTWSLLCAQDLVEHRKKSWELYGYDFMVDDQYKPWLIEINSSPACDYSTKVTEQYVQAALTDLLKVTIDLPAWEAGQKQNKPSPPQASSSSSDQQQQQAESAAQVTPAAAEHEKKGPTSPSTPGEFGDRHSKERTSETAGGNENCGAVDQKVGGDGQAEAEGREKPPDTGLWRLLYKGAFVPFPVASFGTDLALKGSRIANSKRARRSPHTVKL
eukprot:g6322.t2